MKNALTVLLICLLSVSGLHAEITLEQCVQKATANYPAIRKYNLIKASAELDLSDINKSWLPRIGVYAQGTAQNVVPAFPQALSGVLENMGQSIRGLGKLQYKVGADVSQTIWDGGTAAAGRALSRSQQAMQEAALDVELYQIRQRVENLYFAILLTDEQTAQARNSRELLSKNLERLKSMLRNGTAMQADVDMLEAQVLTLSQNIIQAESAAAGYRKALSVFVGENIAGETLALPAAVEPVATDGESARPELRLFERQLEYNDANRRLADRAVMPRIGLFAQAYYGYPGFDYFRSMMNRSLSFNIIAGIKLSWNIDSFYTRRNTGRRTAVKAQEVAADRDIFRFNTQVQTASQTETIRGLREMMKDDARIVELRTNVREAAESQLANGVIDVTALLTKITDENNARLTARYHQILLLQEIYKLKYTLDR